MEIDEEEKKVERGYKKSVLRKLKRIMESEGKGSEEEGGRIKGIY